MAKFQMYLGVSVCGTASINHVETFRKKSVTFHVYTFHLLQYVCADIIYLGGCGILFISILDSCYIGWKILT